MSQSPRFAAMMEFVYDTQVAGRAPKVCKPATHDGLVVTFLRHVANSSVCVFSSSGRLGDGIGAGLDHAVGTVVQPRLRINRQPFEQLSQFWSEAISTRSCDRVKLV